MCTILLLLLIYLYIYQVQEEHEDSLFIFIFIRYKKNTKYFDIIEINILTIFFSSFVLISVERLTCIILNFRYKSYVTKSLIKTTLLATWLIGLTPGFAFWAAEKSALKVYYYMFFDFLIVLLTFISYLGIWVIYRRTQQGSLCDEKAHHANKKKLNILRVPLLILTAFLVCNCIPDIANTLLGDDPVLYDVMVVLWGLGYFIDPCLYIFINKQTREIAKSCLMSVCSADVDRESRRMMLNDRRSTFRTTMTGRVRGESVL